MTFATKIASKSLTQARNARVTNRLCSMESRRGKATTAMANALSMESAGTTKTSPLADEARIVLRQFYSKEQHLKGRLTIEEVKCALEPLTRAREQAKSFQRSIPKSDKKPLRL